MNTVEVVTGARLHFGLICGTPQSAHRFGGIGLMIRRPGWHLTADHGSTLQCVAESDEVRDRITGLLPQACQLAGLSGIHVRVHEAVPLHHGLGAGTQLTLAVTTAVQVLAGKPRTTSSLDLAAQLNRVRRSAVGAFGFDRGGLIVDHGVSADASSRRLQNYDLPADWRVLLLLPDGGAGLSGTEEETVFEEPRFMSDDLVARQNSLIHDVIVPAVEDDRLQNFRDGLGQFGRNAGQFFAPQQGGVYSSPVIRKFSADPDFADLQPAQSSWGPAAAIVTASPDEAQQLQKRIEATPFASHLNCLTAEPLRCGATVRTVAPEVSDQVVRG